MPNFVKPGAIKTDKRSDDEKRRDLSDSLFANLIHMQAECVKQGHTMEQVLAWCAKQAFGIVLPTESPEVIAARQNAREQARTDAEIAAANKRLGTK